MKNLFITYLEKAVNTYIQQDARSSKHLEKLSGKTLSVELMPWQLQFNCSFADDRMQITLEDDIVTHAKIKGTPLQLTGALLQKSKRKQFFADDLQIEGDAEFAQQVTELFDEIQIDWEDHASRLVGDVPAYHLAKFANNVRDWFQKTEDHVTQDVNDYLHEETACFPTKEELTEFFADIDTLRMDLDRLEARIAHVKSQLTQEEKP